MLPAPAKTDKSLASLYHFPTHPQVFPRFLACVSENTPVSDHFRHTPASFRPFSCMCVQKTPCFRPLSPHTREFFPDFLHDGTQCKMNIPTPVPLLSHPTPFGCLSLSSASQCDASDVMLRMTPPTTDVAGHSLLWCRGWHSPGIRIDIADFIHICIRFCAGYFYATLICIYRALFLILYMFLKR